jgi:hypothetical protein
MADFLTGIDGEPRPPQTGLPPGGVTPGGDARPGGDLSLTDAIMAYASEVATQGAALTALLEELRRQNAAIQKGLPVLGLTQSLLPATERGDHSAAALSLDADGHLRTRARRIITQDLTLFIPAGQTDSARVRIMPRPTNPETPVLGTDMSDLSLAILFDDPARAAAEVITTRIAFSPVATDPSWIAAGGNTLGATVGVVNNFSVINFVAPFVMVRSAIAVAAARSFRLIIQGQ